MVNFTQIMEEGIKAGNEIVREILSMKHPQDPDGKPLISKHKMAKDLKVEKATVYNWYRGLASPRIDNYHEIKNYRLYAERLMNFPRYKRSA